MNRENEIENPTAFPSKHHSSGMFQGMTLRDYFAAKAMQSYLSDPLANWDSSELISASRLSYEAADAMLKERSKK